MSRTPRASQPDRDPADTSDSAADTLPAPRDAPKSPPPAAARPRRKRETAATSAAPVPAPALPEWATPFAPLSDAERMLMDAARAGETCDLLARWPGDEGEDSRVLRPAFFRALCVAKDAVDPNGVSVNGAVFREDMVLRDLDMAFGLTFTRCRFDGGMDINGACLRYLDLPGSTVHGRLNAAQARVTQNVSLTRSDNETPFVAANAVVFSGACIFGFFNCEGARFNHGKSVCLNAQGIEVTQGVFLDQAEFTGQVDFNSAKVGGQFSCDGAKFHYAAKRCLDAENIEVGKGVFFRSGLVARGQVDFTLAKIGSLNFEEAEIESLILYHARIEDQLFLSDVTIG